MKGVVYNAKKITQEEFENRLKIYTNDTFTVISKYVNKRTPVLIKCKNCGYEWSFSPSTLMPNNVNKHTFKGCPECKYQEVECNYCHKKFKRLKSQLAKDNKSGYVYCSKECGNRHKNEFIKNTVDACDYRRNAFLAYEHKCAVCGWDEDERILEVHHIDENRKNNNINNLIILCPICHKKLTLHLYDLDGLMN